METSALPGDQGGLRRGRVSILMPMRDARLTIEECIRSVVEQIHIDWELLVVDAGSVDGSAQPVTSHGDSRIRLFRSPSPMGPGEARTLALGHATGEWVTVLDADDVSHRQRLERLLAAATRHNPGTILTDRIVRWPSLDPVPDSLRMAELEEVPTTEWVWSAVDWLVRSRAGQPFIPHAPLREHDVTSPATSMGEDTAFVIRAVARAGLGPIVELRDPTYVYRKIPGAWTGLSAPDEGQMQQLRKSMEGLLPDLDGSPLRDEVGRQARLAQRLEDTYAILRLILAGSLGPAARRSVGNPAATFEVVRRAIRNRRGRTDAVAQPPGGSL